MPLPTRIIWRVGLDSPFHVVMANVSNLHLSMTAYNRVVGNEQLEIVPISFRYYVCVSTGHYPYMDEGNERPASRDV